MTPKRNEKEEWRSNMRTKHKVTHNTSTTEAVPQTKIQAGLVLVVIYIIHKHPAYVPLDQKVHVTIENNKQIQKRNNWSNSNTEAALGNKQHEQYITALTSKRKRMQTWIRTLSLHVIATITSAAEAIT